MTGWTIEAGYQHDVSREEVADALVAAAERLRNAALGGGDHNAIRDYLDPAKSPAGMIVRRPPHLVTDENDDGLPCISLAASGGDPERSIKEIIARGICITLMTQMHDQGFNVSVHCS